MADTLMPSFWSLETLDVIYRHLADRKVPLSAESCNKLAKILAQVCIDHDERMVEWIMRNDNPEYQKSLPYLWEPKEIKQYKDRGYVWIKQVNNKTPKLLIVFDGCSLKVDDWEAQKASRREFEGNWFYSFEWFTKPMSPETKWLYNRLKEQGRVYKPYEEKGGAND